MGFKETIIRTGSRALLIAQKHSPEILMAVGTATTVGAVILTGKASLRVSDILEEHEETKDKIEKVYSGEIEVEAEYLEDDYKKDIFTNKMQCAREIAINYIPAVTLLAFGIGCFFGAHNILSKRYIAMAGMYKLCEESFAAYRSRVKDELGEDQDRHFYYGTEIEETVEKIEGKGGKIKEKKSKVEVYPGVEVTQYARYFDEANPNWQRSADDNRFFLTNMQRQLNDKLVSQGHLFLNEVYDALGFERSSAGALVGWVYSDGDINQTGDGYVDFRIYDFVDAAKRDFVNGYEPSILLDFNVDGLIYDLI